MLRSTRPPARQSVCRTSSPGRPKDRPRPTRSRRGTTAARRTAGSSARPGPPDRPPHPRLRSSDLSNLPHFSLALFVPVVRRRRRRSAPPGRGRHPGRPPRARRGTCPSASPHRPPCGPAPLQYEGNIENGRASSCQDGKTSVVLWKQLDSRNKYVHIDKLMYTYHEEPPSKRIGYSSRKSRTKRYFGRSCAITHSKTTRNVDGPLSRLCVSCICRNGTDHRPR